MTLCQAVTQKEVVSIIYGTWDMALRIPDLGKAFTLTALDKKNDRKEETVTNGVICDLRPGGLPVETKRLYPATELES